MADYYWNAQFGTEAEFAEWLNTTYTYVCTCTEDANNISQLMFHNEMQSGEENRYDTLDTCSEVALSAKRDSQYRMK